MTENLSMLISISVSIVAIGCFAFGFSIGYLTGAIKERRAWNDLIVKGIIPNSWSRRTK